MAKKVYSTANGLLDAVHAHLVKLNEKGGEIEFPFRQEYRKSSGSVIKPSTSGSCARQLAYLKLMPDEAEDFTPRALSVFLMGHMTEAVEQELIAAVTPLNMIQDRVEFWAGQAIGYIPGYVDGVVNIGGKLHVMDIKSAADFSFKEMQREGAPYKYLCQMQCYMDALGLDNALLWVVNKNTQHRQVIHIERDQEVLNEIRERFRSVDIATLDELPDRMFEPRNETYRRKETGREILPWQCSYCPFTKECWGPEGFQLHIEKGKPKWVRGEKSDA